ncbi:MAG: glutamine-hydrolyzing GMP synthase [Bacteroidia bacterium]|nr:glutamine-hydrolyzing GMP synthase [Bacteroidia bacterium]
MNQKVLIVDFGSQFTQLIARRIRELNMYCEIVPFYAADSLDTEVQALILSGSPCSVNDPEAPGINLSRWIGQVPVLGVCYGAQLIARDFGGTVARSGHREYGRAHFSHIPGHAMLSGIPQATQVWMSHGDTITQVPEGYTVTGYTDTVAIAAFEHTSLPVYAVQFHPEVYHTTEGTTLLHNFLVNIAGIRPDWTPAAFVEATVADLRAQLGQDRVICGLSGGVDSTVAATLIHRAIGDRLYCVFVNNGLLRLGEYEQVMEHYQQLGLNVIGVDASERFLSALAGISDPEQKRKTIGRVFIEVFQDEAHKLEGIQWLAQGTIYPDVIESVSVKGPSATIKSHHNVGGLPAQMKMKVVEPLRFLFKDEVRRVGHDLGLAPSFLGRHPFPGPGLAIRIPGEITPEKIRLLQAADDIFIRSLREDGLYDQVWQAFAVLLPVATVGVMGDERTYEAVLALRAVTSTDGMTADWAHLPYEFLGKVSSRIINEVRGINRVVYDISSKPPATIEWE